MKKYNEAGVYKQVQRFADLTIAMILKGNMERAKKCIGVAEMLLIKGNYQTKNAILNVYLFSVSSILELHHYKLEKLFSDNLRIEYIKQTNTF